MALFRLRGMGVELILSIRVMVWALRAMAVKMGCVIRDTTAGPEQSYCGDDWRILNEEFRVCLG